MRIVYLIDYNCPYSYIGLNRLRNAVKSLDLDVEWEMRSFELEPSAGKRQSVTTAENYVKKYGISEDEAEERIEEIERTANEDGLKINYKDMLLVSSKDALRLTKFVQNKYPELTLNLVEAIFESNLIRNENIRKEKVLADIAVSCGIDESEALKIIENNYYNIEIELDKDEALSNGITATPCFILFVREERLMIPGVFSEEEFRIALKDFISGEIKNKSFI